MSPAEWAQVCPSPHQEHLWLSLLARNKYFVTLVSVFFFFFFLTQQSQHQRKVTAWAFGFYLRPWQLKECFQAFNAKKQTNKQKIHSSNESMQCWFYMERLAWNDIFIYDSIYNIYILILLIIMKLKICFSRYNLCQKRAYFVHSTAYIPVLNPKIYSQILLY